MTTAIEKPAMISEIANGRMLPDIDVLPWKPITDAQRTGVTMIVARMVDQEGRTPFEPMVPWVATRFWDEEVGEWTSYSMKDEYVDIGAGRHEWQPTHYLDTSVLSIAA